MSNPNQNQDIFNLYKPLRNKIRSHNLYEALYLVWGFSRNLTFNLPIPTEIEVPTRFNYSAKKTERRVQGIAEFELEFLLREFIIHCHTNPDKNSILKTAHLAKIINYYRHTFQDGILTISSINEENILLDSNRWSHQQFKWQLGYDQDYLLKYHKIFSSPQVNNLVKEATGMTVLEIHLAGFYVFSVSKDQFLNSPITSTHPILSQEVFDRFFKIFSMSIDEAKDKSLESYRMDETILYSFNPVTSQPILTVNDQFICPLHLLLFWRITNGLYYFICDSPKYKVVFGDAFEDYIGEVIGSSNRSGNYKSIKEILYGKSQKKSSDWIIVDPSSIIFVECKSKRMTLASKSEKNLSNALDSDINTLSNAVVQIYKTYIDYQNNQYSALEFDENLYFVPILVTLEPWFINYNLILPEKIKTMVKEKMSALKMDPSMVDLYPYYILSSGEFEDDIQIIAESGGKFYSELHKSKAYAEYTKTFKYQEIFPEQFEEIFLNPLKQQSSQ